MLEFEYTIHAEWKLKLSEVRKLKINKQKIQKIVKTAETIDKSEEPVLIAIGGFSKELSLCIVYRRIEGRIRIITFYPAEKGRYERKILSRR